MLQIVVTPVTQNRKWVQQSSITRRESTYMFEMLWNRSTPKTCIERLSVCILQASAYMFRLYFVQTWINGFALLTQAFAAQHPVSVGFYCVKTNQTTSKHSLVKPCVPFAIWGSSTSLVSAYLGITTVLGVSWFAMPLSKHIYVFARFAT